MQDNVFWFRRDLRLHDNAGLYHALKSGPVRCIFIFDRQILSSLRNQADARVHFIHEQVIKLKEDLRKHGSDLEVFFGDPEKIFSELLLWKTTKAVYTNGDYEPSAIRRDQGIFKLCQEFSVEFHAFKDQVIFAKDEILTEARAPYTVFTPYKNKWLKSLSPFYVKSIPTEDYFQNLMKVAKPLPLISLTGLGFKKSQQIFPPSSTRQEILKQYAEQRDFPAQAGTSRLGVHLRFGTISIRQTVRLAQKTSDVWLSELIWREFFMQILFHFPRVEKKSFRENFDELKWRQNKIEFEKWCQGQTGYPFVDAGMRELNQTGFMHNRVRMIAASFLTKHLLMHWSLGEKYFAEKLLDYDLAANNGNWQWAAGTGCDAAPYFRIFNPELQMKRFDPDGEYVKKWVPEWGTPKYVRPMVDHQEARGRALREFAVLSIKKKK